MLKLLMKNIISPISSLYINEKFDYNSPVAVTHIFLKQKDNGFGLLSF